jgi:hypothetical protein
VTLDAHADSSCIAIVRRPKSSQVQQRASSQQQIWRRRRRQQQQRLAVLRAAAKTYVFGCIVGLENGDTQFTKCRYAHLLVALSALLLLSTYFPGAVWIVRSRLRHPFKINDISSR